MGMDLVGAGYTRRTDKVCDLDAIDGLIDRLPDATLRDEVYLNRIDPTENILNIVADHADTPATVREYLKAGAREFVDASDGHRLSVSFDIAGSPLVFVFSGGGSWGDDPWDGFSDLCLFLNFAENDSHIREASGFVSWGLPSKLIISSIGEVD